MATVAKYDGKCKLCGNEILANETIISFNGDYDIWVCKDCGDVKKNEPKLNPVCQVCWLEHPEGACDRQ